MLYRIQGFHRTNGGTWSSQVVYASKEHAKADARQADINYPETVHFVAPIDLVKEELDRVA